MAAEEVREGIGFSHLDQLLLDGSSLTKRDLVDYLDAIADRMVPVLAQRALSVIRVRPGSEPFMQKNAPKYAPDWLPTVSYWAERSHREVAYPLCNDRRTLLWFANQRAVEFHPALFLVGEATQTHLVMDIDPPEGGRFALAVHAAHLVHQAMDALGLQGAVKTSGAKGVHVFVPIVATPTDDVAAATRALAARAERLDPASVTTAFVREDRDGKVFLDSTRAGGATVAAAYSPRVRDDLPVSMPIGWDELDSVDPRDATVRTALGLLGDRDPWAELMPAPQPLPDELIEHGRTIPIARVQAMHAGKRRARERREQESASAADQPVGDQS